MNEDKLRRCHAHCPRSPKLSLLAPPTNEDDPQPGNHNPVSILHVAVKDTNDYVVEKIVDHDFSNFNDKRWLVQRWSGTKTPDKTWDNYETLKDVEAFHHYCEALQLDPFPPK